MNVKLLRDGAAGDRYLETVAAVLRSDGIAAECHTLKDWQTGKGSGNPKTDLVVVDSEHVAAVAAPYAVVAVERGCAMEDALRSPDAADAAARRLAADAQCKAVARARTFWVACSEWAAAHCRRHTGRLADRIILPGVDVDAVFPSARQVKRETKVPVVMHDCGEPRRGSACIDAVATALAGAFAVKRLGGKPSEMAEALRGADLWLSLDASEQAVTHVPAALASDLVVVGTNVGALWPYCCGTRAGRADVLGGAAWLNREVGAVVFDWRHRADPALVGKIVREAWAKRGEVRGREYARRWYSMETFRRKWHEAVLLAGQRLEVTA